MICPSRLTEDPCTLVFYLTLTVLSPDYPVRLSFEISPKPHKTKKTCQGHHNLYQMWYLELELRWRVRNLFTYMAVYSGSDSRISVRHHTPWMFPHPPMFVSLWIIGFVSLHMSFSLLSPSFCVSPQTQIGIHTCLPSKAMTSVSFLLPQGIALTVWSKQHMKNAENSGNEPTHRLRGWRAKRV